MALVAATTECWVSPTDRRRPHRSWAAGLDAWATELVSPSKTFSFVKWRLLGVAKGVSSWYGVDSRIEKNIISSSFFFFFIKKKILARGRIIQKENHCYHLFPLNFNDCEIIRWRMWRPNGTIVQGWWLGAAAPESIDTDEMIVYD